MKCAWCPPSRVFADERSLAEHLGRHPTHVTSATQHLLASSKRPHATERGHCDDCDVDVGDLQQHLTRHANGEKCCIDCDAWLSSASALSHHRGSQRHKESIRDALVDTSHGAHNRTDARVLQGRIDRLNREINDLDNENNDDDNGDGGARDEDNGDPDFGADARRDKRDDDEYNDGDGGGGGGDDDDDDDDDDDAAERDRQQARATNAAQRAAREAAAAAARRGARPPALVVEPTLRGVLNVISTAIDLNEPLVPDNLPTRHYVVGDCDVIDLNDLLGKPTARSTPASAMPPKVVSVMRALRDARMSRESADSAYDALNDIDGDFPRTHYQAT